MIGVGGEDLCPYMSVASRWTRITDKNERDIDIGWMDEHSECMDNRYTCSKLHTSTDQSSNMSYMKVTLYQRVRILRTIRALAPPYVGGEIELSFHLSFFCLHLSLLTLFVDCPPGKGSTERQTSRAGKTDSSSEFGNLGGKRSTLIFKRNSGKKENGRLA